MMLKSNRMLKCLAFAGASRYKWNDEVEPPAALCNNSICISHTHFVGSLLFLSILFFFSLIPFPAAPPFAITPRNHQKRLLQFMKHLHQKHTEIY